MLCRKVIVRSNMAFMIKHRRQFQLQARSFTYVLPQSTCEQATAFYQKVCNARFSFTYSLPQSTRARSKCLTTETNTRNGKSHTL